MSISKKDLCIIACIIIGASVFFPYISVSIFGASMSASLFDGGDGTIILVIAAIALICSVCEQYFLSAFLGMVSLGIFTMENANMAPNHVEYNELARALLQNGTGYYLLLIGSIMLIAFSILALIEKPKKQSNYKTQLEDSSLFYSGDVVNQQQIQQAAPKEEKPIAQGQMADRPAAQQPAPKKKGGFKGIVISALIVAVMYLIGSYVGEQIGGATKNGSSKAPVTSSASSGNQRTSTSVSSAMTDLLTRHVVLVKEMDTGFRQYQVLYYGNDTHRLKKWSFVLVGAKNAGFTVSGLRSLYKQDEWPSFTQVRYFDDNDYAVASYDFDNLENIQRIRELIRYELLADMPESEIAKGAVDTDSLVSSIKKMGYQDASMLDYSLLHLK